MESSATKEVKPLKLGYTATKEKIDNYWADMLPNSYMIIDSITDDAMLISLNTSAPNICRDGYLFSIAKWANDGKEKTMLSALFTTVDSAILYSALTHTANMWHGIFPKLDFRLCAVVHNSVHFQCVVFTVTKKMVENPLTFWLLTDDLRHSCTGRHKYKPDDSPHTSGAYTGLVANLRFKVFHVPVADRQTPQCLIPSKYVSAEASSYACRSPLEYLERVQFVNNILAAIAIDPQRYSPNIKSTYYLCHYIEKIALQIFSKTYAGPMSMTTLNWVRGAYSALNRLDKPPSE